MTSKITMFLIAGVVALGMFLGFSTNDNPNGSKTNTSSSSHPVYNPPQVTAAYYTDNFDATNDTTALKARGYKVYYRGGGPQGTTATWFQGNETVFPAFNGPPTGYVAANYNAVTGANPIDSWLVLPRLNVGNGDTISFYSQAPLASTFPDSVRVMYSAAGDSTPEATSWVELGRFKVNTLGIWEKKAYRTASAGANGRFAIRYAVVNAGPLGSNSDYIGIDALNVSSGGTGPVACVYSWSPATSGTTSQLLTVSTVSNLVGWAAGVGPTVVRTINGTTWTSATGTGITGDVYNIWGVDANTAFCTTSPAATFIYKTTNGGSTWTQVYTIAGGFIDAIQMVSATEGYALGDPLAAKWLVLKTTDGGNTWARMATEPAQVGAEAGWNNSFQIVGTHMWFGTNSTKVYHSPDLGLTWSSGPTTGTVNSYAVHFNSATNGLASGTAVVGSTNGGTSYTAVSSPGTAGNISGLEGAGTDWWATRSGADVYRSTNFGASWTSAHTQAGAVFQDIDFKVVGGCPQGWAVGNGGAIAKMTALTGITNYNTEIPSAYSLNQNYPNPFNPSTNINFSIPKSGIVTLKIYDMTGREIASLLNEFKSAGNYVVGYNAAGLSSGTYFYKIEASEFTATKKMVLIK